MNLSDVARGATYTDTRGNTWHATLTGDGKPALISAGNPTLRRFEDVEDAWGPLVRSSFTVAELTVIAEALATHHDECEPLEGGPAATLRPRVRSLLKRASPVERMIANTRTP
ncbi:hypothetical protein [Nocardiopsis sp. FR26]|uniref:hypothetical protein n=1 Tax=Nocardiopsis sp. FR26 TaxID=2605987 RepID=UPI0013572622|nr:hypothetical protein [Nocardiopsis sp. FR26]